MQLLFSFNDVLLTGWQICKREAFFEFFELGNSYRSKCKHKLLFCVMFALESLPSGQE